MSEYETSDLLDMTAEIVSSYVSNNQVEADALPQLIRNIFETVSGLADAVEPVVETQDPAVPISKSILPDYLVCLEDGRKLKMLKRYLRSKFDMTPEEYRAKWGLPADYPMVAPNYAKLRSKHAKQIGLGKKAAPRPKKTK
ncbi:MucR family transcriptional regulator [Hyphomonas sp.]|jgi:predicted transcriptional regulator|uniref:MucR family transcriptional regulator n=1 Tax=Hyphomonas sp. TaxID=87 RepID=UPI000C5DE103|nr:MucR family transcriptional regulator [Hyphomonadaceae bacterium]MBA27572.1 MucR family transcriptional regulator [Hyphomonadaceae bacterium]MBL4879382.1 MucR family transcriptional regulator [Hyphomonas sp.]|tara:strand:+ start:628 stop:1050 length:423 start_codon:yes stop_codon:yes gene_type:complete